MKRHRRWRTDIPLGVKPWFVSPSHPTFPLLLLLHGLMAHKLTECAAWQVCGPYLEFKLLKNYTPKRNKTINTTNTSTRNSTIQPNRPWFVIKKSKDSHRKPLMSSGWHRWCPDNKASSSPKPNGVYAQPDLCAECSIWLCSKLQGLANFSLKCELLVPLYNLLPLVDRKLGGTGLQDRILIFGSVSPQFLENFPGALKWDRGTNAEQLCFGCPQKFVLYLVRVPSRSYPFLQSDNINSSQAFSVVSLPTCWKLRLIIQHHFTKALAFHLQLYFFHNKSKHKSFI